MELEGSIGTAMLAGNIQSENRLIMVCKTDDEKMIKTDVNPVAIVSYKHQMKRLVIKNVLRKHKKGPDLAPFTYMGGPSKALALPSPSSIGAAKIRSRL